MAEAADPAGVPEHDLLRQRRLRRAAGRARLLRPRREGPDDRGGGAARRHPRRPEPLRPGREPRPRQGAAADRARARCSRSRRSRRPSTPRRTRPPLPDPDEVRLPGTEGQHGALHFVNYVKQQLIDEYGSAEVFGGGLKVRTTIDLELPAGRARRDLEVADRTRTAPPPRSSRSTRATAPSRRWSAATTTARASSTSPSRASASPARRSSRSCSRRRSARESRRRRTSSRSRRRSISATSTGSSGTTTTQYHGSIDLETATIESDNAVYAQLTQLVGSKNVAETAKRLGIRSKLDGYYAIGLGAEAVTPLELARAYATLAHGGRRVDGTIFENRPRVIEESCRRRHGARSTRRRRSTRSAPRRRASSTRSCSRPCEYGTGKRAYLPNRPVAGKTGTTENYGDAWFVGYTPQLAVAVWVGYPTTLKPMLTEFHGEAVTGGSFPALIWKSFVEKALKGEEARGLPRIRPSPTPRRSSSPGAATGCCSTTASASPARRSSTSPAWARRRPRTAS